MKTPASLQLLCVVFLVLGCQSEKKEESAGGRIGDRKIVSAPTGDNKPSNDGNSVIGFDSVSKIFNNSKYGPCSLCHVSEWPFLIPEPADGPRGKSWARFLESLDHPRTGEARSKERLAELIADCVDQNSDKQCAGDSGDSSDNVDFKMPTKYGFEAVSAEDLATLKLWIAGGVQSLEPESN